MKASELKMSMCATQGDYYRQKIQLLEKELKEVEGEKEFRIRLWLDVEKLREENDKLATENAHLRLKLAAYQGPTRV